MYAGIILVTRELLKKENDMTTEAKIYHIDEMPWVDLGGGHHDKAMVTEPKTGMIVNVSYYPKGYRMGWHRHSCAHGMYIIKGAMQTNIGLVKQGEFVWFPADTEMDHGATMEEDCMFLFITNAPFDIQPL